MPKDCVKWLLLEVDLCPSFIEVFAGLLAVFCIDDDPKLDTDDAWLIVGIIDVIGTGFSTSGDLLSNGSTNIIIMIIISILI